MTCEQFARCLAALSEGGAADEDADIHVEGCSACGVRLSRARALVRALTDLPEVEPPPGIEVALRAHLAVSLSSPPRHFGWKAAAAALVMVAGGLGLALTIDGDPGYEPLDLRVVEEAGTFDEEDPGFEEIYGPETPFLMASGGGGDGR